MKIIFDDSKVKESLWPLTATRNAADIRTGILTTREKWELILEKEGYGNNPATVTIDAAIVPSRNYVALHAHLSDDSLPVLHTPDDLRILEHPWDIFQINDWALRKDFELLTSGRKSQSLSDTNTLIAPGNIFAEEGAAVECSVINATNGPVYLGKNAVVMEGCLIRGPFALGEGATLKMGTKVYGATTIGPYCVAGGEIKNTVMFGYSNKAHDGYLGDSVIGEWCNFGAGTTNSNLKNTAGALTMWSQSAGGFVEMGTRGGLIMGDYSRAAINTSFNTGTVVGVCCNVVAQGFPAKKIDSFTWINERYIFENAIRDIDNWKKLKGKSITPEEKDILEQLYNQSI